MGTDPINLKGIIPDIIHFVWIGSITPDVELYIRVWENYNKDKEVILWQDRDSEICMKFQRQLYMSMRVFLTESFFTSRGMTLENVREWLHRYRQWAVTACLQNSAEILCKRLTDALFIWTFIQYASTFSPV